MTTSKKGKDWFAPSFTFDNSRKSPPAKRRKSETVVNNLSNDLSTYEIYQRKKTTKNLSALLAACEPKTPTDLVVSRQKQKEISEWLNSKVQEGKAAALVLMGPAGCGKTAAIKLLARERGFDITEWITPIDQLMDENNRIMRQGDKFEEFVIKATRYTSLLSEVSRRLLIVKEFPNVYYDDSESFFSMLGKYFELGKEPIVFICTDTGNSKVQQALLGHKVRDKFGLDFININAVTPTAMKVALKRITPILNANASEILHVTEKKVEEILSNSIGDIRSALLNLIFISLKVPDEISKNSNTIREQALGLLHGVGRVINPKRVQEGESWKFVHNPDEIASYFQSQATVFNSFLQENYLNTVRTIEEANKAATVMSITERFSTEWRNYNLTKLTLSLGIRGVMVNNEKPVTAWNPVRKPPSDQSNMRRCLAAAELRWYESLIKPSKESKEEHLDCGEGGIVE